MNAALQELRDILRSPDGTGEGAEQAVLTVAEEYELSPADVRRSWREKYGCAPIEFAEREAQSRKSLQTLQEASTLRAVTKAQTIARTRWQVQGMHAELAGRLFKLGDQTYAFVVYVKDDPEHAVRAINIQTLRVDTLSIKHLDEIAGQLHPGLRFER